jgi:hypothetical protein
MVLGCCLGIAACASEPQSSLSVAMRPLGGDWQVDEIPCGQSIVPPAGVPYELVTWGPDLWTEMVQAGPEDAPALGTGVCGFEPFTYDVVGVPLELTSVSYSAGTPRDVVATTSEAPPRFILLHDVDSEHVTLDFAKAGALLESRAIDVAGAPTDVVSEVVTRRGATLERHEQPAWFIPSSALLPGDREEIQINFDSAALVTFDMRADQPDPLTATRPDFVVDAHWTPGGVGVTTQAPINEWTLRDHARDICELPCSNRPWEIRKMSGWPETIESSGEVTYVDVSAIPGFGGGGRPIEVTTVQLCARDAARSRCVTVDASKQ